MSQVHAQLINIEDRTILGTLKMLLKSRRVLLLLVYLVLSIVVRLVPALLPLKDNLSEIFAGVITVIAGLSLQDGIATWQAGKTTLPLTDEDAVRELILRLFDDVFVQQPDDEIDAPPAPVPTPDPVPAPTDNGGFGDGSTIGAG